MVPPPPTGSSPYNLRTRSSTSVSPVKRENPTVTTKKPGNVKRRAESPKPSEPAPKISNTVGEEDEVKITVSKSISDIENVPNVIVEALLQLQLTNLPDLAEHIKADTDVDGALIKLQESVLELVQAAASVPTVDVIESSKEDQSGEKAPLVSLVESMKKDIVKAWISYLVYLSGITATATSNGDDSDKKNDWRDFIPQPNERRSPKVPLEGIDMEKFEAAWTALQAIKPRDLVKQRQALKKCGPPRGADRITHDKLRQGKAQLVRIPTGEAISEAVSQELLVETKESLRKVVAVAVELQPLEGEGDVLNNNNEN